MKLKKRLFLCWRILRAEPGNLMAHANRELPSVGTDEMGMLMADQLRELVLVFSTHGHSGFSASYATNILDRLLRFKPIAPLTGEPDEWLDCGSFKQNKRCSTVFMQPDRFNGQPYNMDSIVFRESGGTYFTGCGSAQPISFPYTPPESPIYLDVDDDGNPLNGWNREGVYADWLAHRGDGVVSVKETP